MISIGSIRAGSRAPFASFSRQLRRHKAVTRVVAATTALAIAAAVSAGGSAQAGFNAVLPAPPSILPVNIGVGIASSDAVRVGWKVAPPYASTRPRASSSVSVLARDPVGRRVLPISCSIEAGRCMSDWSTIPSASDRLATLSGRPPGSAPIRCSRAAAEVTIVAWWSAISRLHPRDATASIGPGTANTSRP